MKKAYEPGQAERGDKAMGEALDALNLETRQRGPRETRRHIEGRIEERARKRRSSEKPASSGFKQT